jgi:pyruvate,water dikinase
MLSHASVISRELHIPCVIGIKLITKRIKEGEILEVDAMQGIVTIVS